METSVIKEPLIIYRDILIPLLQASGFEFDFDASDDKRYHTRFLWRSSYVETDLCSDFYGQTRKFESKIDVVGIPMGHNFLILHGIIVGSLADDCDDVKLKVRCARRTKSLSCSSTDSAGSVTSSSSLPSSSVVVNQINSLVNELSNSGNNVEPEPTEEYKERIRLQLQSEFVYKLIEMFSVRLDDLPMELKLKIMANLPLKSIVSMSRVSTNWRELSLDEQLWRLMVQKFFPDLFERRVTGQSWKALFKDEFRRQRVLEKRRAFAASRNAFHIGYLPALPPGSPPLLPIAPPPFMPMLPPPPTYIRDLLTHHPNQLMDPFWDDHDRHENGIDIPVQQGPSQRPATPHHQNTFYRQ